MDSLQRAAGIAALFAALGGILYGYFFVIAGTVAVASALLMLGGLLLALIIVVLGSSLEDVNRPLARLAMGVGFLGAMLSMVHGGYDLANEIHPPGVTAGDVIERRDRLAAGLARPLGCVWPEGRPEVHPGRLVLWVGDQDMATTPGKPWPLVKAASFDISKALPFGTDPRGRLVPMELPYTNLLIGAIPGYGKTAAIQVPMLAAALDPRSDSHQSIEIL